MVHRFLAFSSWKDNGFQNIEHLRQPTSHLAWFARATVYHIAFHNFEDNLTPTQTSEELEIAQEIFKKSVKDYGTAQDYDNLLKTAIGRRLAKYHFYIREKPPTPFASVMGAKYIIKKAEMCVGRDGKLVWAPNSNYTELEYDSVRVRITDLSRGYFGMLDKLRELCDELLRGFAVPGELNMSREYMDNSMSQGHDASFLGDSYLKSIESLLFSHLGSKQAFYNSVTKTWDTVKIADWQIQADEFMDYLMAAIHIAGGQPARAPEFTSVLYRNCHGSIRGTCIRWSKFSLVTRYHKGRWMQGHDRPVSRFLPLELSQILLVYLALIRPCEIAFMDINTPQDIDAKKACGIYMYQLFVKRGIAVSAKAMSDTFGRIFKKVTNVNVTFAQYRHISQAFILALVHDNDINAFGDYVSNEIIGEDPDDNVQNNSRGIRTSAALNPGGAIANAIDMQAGHTPQIADQNYALSNESMLLLSAQRVS
ncbi:hypothetical protein H4R20_003656, partial [Coemansia guatemalensis]